MTVNGIITPDIAPLLPTDSIVEARGRVLVAELGRLSHPGKGVQGRRVPSRRSLAALGAVAAIAVVTTLELPDGGLVSQAQAFPVFATPHVTPRVVADSILGSFLKSQGSVPGGPPNAPDAPYWRHAANRAYAFPTYWGSAYTFKRYDPAHGYTVCTIYPDNQTAVIPDHGGWVGGCHTATTLAGATAGWTTIPDPSGVEFVQLVPAGTTAHVTIGRGTAKAVPVQNGVLSIRVTSPATVTVDSGSTTDTHHLDPATSAVSGGAPSGSQPCINSGARGGPATHAEPPWPCQPGHGGLGRP